MTKRVIVGIKTDAELDWPRLRSALLQGGATAISEPQPYQPDVVVATLGDATDAATFMAFARTLAGIRYVEADAMRGTW